MVTTELLGIIGTAIGVITIFINLFRHLSDKLTKDVTSIYAEINYIKQNYARRDDFAQQMDRFDRNLHHVYNQQIATNKRLDELMQMIASRSNVS